MDEDWLNEIDAKLAEDTATVTLSWDDVYRLVRLGRIGIEAMQCDWLARGLTSPRPTTEDA
jgi:hypothetical protein